MTERLTRRIHGNKIMIENKIGFETFSPTAEEDEFIYEALTKLAHYEDLEEKSIEETTYALKTLLWKWQEFYEDIAQFIKWRDLAEQGRLVDASKVVDEGYLYDWYIASVTDAPPVWTEEHLTELYNDFILIPKESALKEREQE